MKGKRKGRGEREGEGRGGRKETEEFPVKSFALPGREKAVAAGRYSSIPQRCTWPLVELLSPRRKKHQFPEVTLMLLEGNKRGNTRESSQSRSIRVSLHAFPFIPPTQPSARDRYTVASLPTSSQPASQPQPASRVKRLRQKPVKIFSPNRRPRASRSSASQPIPRAQTRN